MKCTLIYGAVLALLLSGCTGGASTAPSSQSTPSTPSSSSVQDASQESSSSEADSHTVVVTLPESPTTVVSGVSVKVDPMIELLAIVQYLSEYDAMFGLMSQHKTTYQDDIDLAFGEFKDHEAIKFFNEAIKNNFTFDIPPSACLYLEKDFGISPDYANSDFSKDRMNVDMNTFRDVMERFCVDTKFNEFFTAHQDFYSKMIDQYTASFPTWNMTEKMEDYYGKSIAGYNIILVPLFHQGGFGPSLERADGLHVHSIQGPYDVKEGVPYFGDEEDIADLVIHEFGHALVPINEFNNATMQAEIARSAYLMKPIQEKMSAMAYPSWGSAYEELILRGATIDIVTQNTGVSPEKALQLERKQSFIYIDDVYTILAEYSKNRDKYPVFDDFVPVITDYLLEKHPEN